MNHTAIINRLRHFPTSLAALLTPLPEEDLRWKPAPENWSILEICCHLLDEEREDFRFRLRSTLDNPTSPWPTLDLKNVAELRGYNQREFLPTLGLFVAERAASIRWLESLENPDFDTTYMHPTQGPVLAGELMASWAAHDALHMRQIAKRLYNLAERDAGKHKIVYAGEWTA
jgi:hypothetical protein